MELVAATRSNGANEVTIPSVCVLETELERSGNIPLKLRVVAQGSPRRLREYSALLKQSLPRCRTFHLDTCGESELKDFLAAELYSPIQLPYLHCLVDSTNSIAASCLDLSLAPEPRDLVIQDPVSIPRLAAVHRLNRLSLGPRVPFDVVLATIGTCSEITHLYWRISVTNVQGIPILNLPPPSEADLQRLLAANVSTPDPSLDLCAPSDASAVPRSSYITIPGSVSVAPLFFRSPRLRGSYKSMFANGLRNVSSVDVLDLGEASLTPELAEIFSRRDEFGEWEILDT